jgi:hypothetical protein
MSKLLELGVEHLGKVTEIKGFSHFVPGLPVVPHKAVAEVSKIGNL